MLQNYFNPVLTSLFIKKHTTLPRLRNPTRSITFLHENTEKLKDKYKHKVTDITDRQIKRRKKKIPAFFNFSRIYAFSSYKSTLFKLCLSVRTRLKFKPF